MVATGSIYLIADLVRGEGGGARLELVRTPAALVMAGFRGPWTAVTDPASAR